MFYYLVQEKQGRNILCKKKNQFLQLKIIFVKTEFEKLNSFKSLDSQFRPWKQTQPIFLSITKNENE